ncbi:spindle pole body interacting protein [Amylocystis lapponica]|nr:spindle pole body interacting protein [Amylocystis lapponica]
MSSHCSFVLLADFDIDRGAQLTYQFPQPLGTDEGLLANLMLPDGAEKQPEDWTIFFLNQTPFNTIAPALDTPSLNGHGRASEEGRRAYNQGRPELLYVLNLVRTKLDKTARRGAVVKAMAICTRHPFIQILKPVLLMALDDYFANPSQDCLARLFDAVNSIDISMAPKLSWHEKLIMRTSDRKDVFIEKFEDFVHATLGDPGTATQQNTNLSAASRQAHRTSNSVDSQSSFEEGILMRKREDKEKGREKESSRPESRRAGSQRMGGYSPSEGSFSLDGSAVWVGEESGLDQVGIGINGGPQTGGASASSSSLSSGTAFRGRRSTDVSSSSSNGPHRRDEQTPAPSTNVASTLKDSHFFPALIRYSTHDLPIKLPLSTFSEEVGDYSLIQLVQLFSAPTATLTGPLHPHLHTNGSLTPSLIVLFNALVTEKRIIFLGHHRPAGQVSDYVLSACALGSGCGIILRGFIKRAFPYANLTNRDEWESVPGFIAGVTNPIFEASGVWDLLCDVGSGRMVVSKDIHLNYPAVSPPIHHQLIARTGTIRAEGSAGSEEEIVRQPTRDAAAPKTEYASKPDCSDNLFVEDILAAISFHYGEAHVRARFTEYVTRFVRLAARYEEDAMGSTAIGYPTVAYSEGRLGSGMSFSDEGTYLKELSMNASRIEAWRTTESYRLYQLDFQKMRATNPIQSVDVSHQIWRLRHARKMSDGEAELIMRTLAENLHTYEQVTELLSFLPPHHNGLLPLSMGLFHQSEVVRELTIDIFNELRTYPIGVQFLQALNHFQRYAYVRQAHARETRYLRDQNTLTIPQASYISRSPSNRSESSVGAG